VSKDKPAPLQERIARAIINDAQGQYTEEEKARVKDALDNHPERLADVLREVHAAHEEGGDPCKD
jgi:hypothetical protein